MKKSSPTYVRRAMPAAASLGTGSRTASPSVGSGSGGSIRAVRRGPREFDSAPGVVTLPPTSPENIMYNQRVKYQDDVFDKIPSLKSKATDANTKLEAVEAAATGVLDTWLLKLNLAESKLESVISAVGRVEDSNNIATWILNFGGSLVDVRTPEEEAAQARRQAEDALQNVRGYIEHVRGIRNKLSQRVSKSRLRTWESGGPKQMIEEACPMFGVSQREMLRGWWDPVYDSYLASGSIKPWQTVCDLYRHRTEPYTGGVGFDTRGPASGYGTTTAAGGWGLPDGYVLMRQPRESDPRYRGYPTNTKNTWGIAKLEDGCLPWEACPVDSLTDPSDRARRLRDTMTSLMHLCTDSGFGGIVSGVQTGMDTAKDKTKRMEDKLGRIDWLLGKTYVKRPIKSGIRAIVEGPTRVIAVASLSAFGPMGWLASAIAGEAAVGVVVGQIYSSFRDAATEDEDRAKALRQTTIPNAKTYVVGKFRDWDTVSAATKSDIHTKARRARNKLDLFLDEWASIEPYCRYVYPSRTSAQWQAIGVDPQCDQLTKTFASVMPGWMERYFDSDEALTDPSGRTPGSGGRDAPEIETPFGFYGEADEDHDPLRDPDSIAKKSWVGPIALAALAAGGYYMYTQNKKGGRRKAKRSRAKTRRR